MSQVNNIAKNTSYFTFALILQKVISFSYFIILARFLGPEDLGKYYFAISFTSLFAIIVDIGLANVLMREFARFGNTDNQDAKNTAIKDLVRGIIAIKIFLSAAAVLAVVSVINLLGYPEITKTLVYISVICMILDSFTASFFAIIRGFHNLLFEGLASIIFQSIALVGGVIALKMNLGLAWVMLALVAASVFNFLFSFFLVTKKWKINLKPKWSRGLARQVIILTSPFALYAIFHRVYTFLDSVLLSYFSGDAAVGLYQVPFKIVFALQFLPLAFVASLYPAMSSYWLNDKKRLASSFERAMKYLIIISVPISAGVIVVADKAIVILKSGYEGSVAPLQIIMLALIFIFLNYPIGSLLNAAEKQRINTRNIMITALASIALNLVLIPLYGAMGAAITVFFSNGLMFFLGARQIPALVDFKIREIFIVAGKVLFAAALMAGVALALKNSLHIVPVVLISAAVYFAVLFSAKGVNKEDIISIKDSFLKKPNPNTSGGGEYKIPSGEG